MTKLEIDKIWKRMCEEHIQPSILFKIATEMIQPDENQIKHLNNCVACRTYYSSYKAEKRLYE